MWRIYSSFVLLSLVQVSNSQGTGCSIVTLSSPSASTLYVEWLSNPRAALYQLNVAVVNSTSVAPVVLMQATPTNKVVQGLRPGTLYEVTLKAYEILYSPLCTTTNITLTVPATTQFTTAVAISSTSIRFEWSSVTGADNYILFVVGSLSSSPKTYNYTYTSLSAQIDGLTPSTTYTCYIYSSNSAGRGAKSNTKTVRTLVQPPTNVTITATGKSSIRVIWNPVNKILSYQVVLTSLGKANLTSVQTTTSTFLDISNLDSCTTYIVGVSSINAFLEPGEPSSLSYTASTIIGVTTVSTSYTCSQNAATLTWNQVPGVSMYRATAVDSKGTSMNCSASSTSCQLAALNCGETYTVSVAAISGDCERTSNATSMFVTVPCAPAFTETQHDCASNVIIFRWQPTNNTFYYEATAVDSNNELTECRTLDNTCYFTETTCGQSYTFQVYAVTSVCNSLTSEPKYVQTSPCLPTNVQTSADCNSNKLTTTWGISAGALSYTVKVEGNNGNSYNCSSSSSSNNCEIDGVPCGEQLSVWMVASNEHCSTDRVLGESAQTAPCTPTNVTASADCSQDSATITWVTSYGSLLYFAIAQDAMGNLFQCYSLDTSCVIEGLSCGTIYITVVYGTNLICNSTESQEVTFMTGPCPPTNIAASRDCNLNSAVIVWQNQESGLYTATIEDQNSNKLQCSSNTVNSCQIPSPPCGKKFNVTVTYSDGQCQSTSTAVSMDSVPCGPENVRAHVKCGTDKLNVTWSSPVPADNYSAIISTGMGQPLYCNSTETHCTMGGLLCEHSYTVTVFSVTGLCQSLPSSEVSVSTLPCPPTNVFTVQSCGPEPVSVQWTSSGNAKRYIAEAVSSKGDIVECSTNNTSCNLPGLQCGEVYTISAVGAKGNCTGLWSSTLSLRTKPCPPSGVTSQVMCGDKTAQVLWTPSANAVSYSAKATSQGAPLTCTSSSSYCTLHNLVCGQVYNIQVYASDGICNSNYSTPLWQDQVPCAPESVTTDLLCSTNDLAVHWIPSPLPLNYSVVANLLDGNTSLTCHSNNASCVFSGLQCGQTYDVSVKASSGSCSGPYSPSQIIQTAPCSPQRITAQTHCGINSVVASWDASAGASIYTATLTGPNGFSNSYSSSDLTCSFSNLQCSTTYTIQVKSQNGLCISSPIQTAATTVPCDPMNVTSVLQCGSESATVSWVESTGAVAYTVLAQEVSGLHASCRSSATSCQLNQLQCGKVYNLTVLAEDATCNSTGATTGVLITAPCPPSIQSSDLICGDSSALLSWTPVVNAEGYTVNATDADGHSVSCSSPSGSCTLIDLLCSETYVAKVTAQGGQCDSAPGPSTNIITAPCSPAFTSTEYSCGTNSAVVSWSDPVGRIGFFSQLIGNGYQDSCSTANTTCVFKNLPCGLDFNASIQAQGAKCNSSISVSKSLHSVPCPPVNVSVTLLCSNHSALVTWVGSSSVSYYTVTMTSQNGHICHCQSNSTSCQVPHLHCGETYSVTVTPHSQSCTGIPSAAYSFRAGLCAPSNITVSQVCENSTISWSPVPGAETFTATATGADGHTHTCVAYYSNSCNFTDLDCGENYSVTVATVDQGCKSDPSSAVQLTTVQCPPANLTGSVNCETNSLTLTWSPVTGATYALQWEMKGSTSPPSEQQTTNTSLSVSNLLCGETYIFQIAAQETGCQRRYSLPTEISTGPCQPTNFTAQVDCGTNNGNFSWSNSSGAGFYTVQADGDDGHVAYCSSDGNSCAVKLNCGCWYSAALVASTDSCNSTKHADIHFKSAPCLLDHVVAELDCKTNKMYVNWTKTSGSDEYTAWAMSTDGHRVSCNSTSNHCSIQNLRHGKIYEVAVTSNSTDCEVIAGSDYKVQSAPCGPENTTAELDCSTNIITVTWDHNGTSQNFTAKATSASGVNSTCDSAGSSCSFLDLSCGQLYSFTVTGYTNACISDTSPPTQTLTAPCMPTSVSAELNCTSNKALISWRPGASVEATAYNAQAVSSVGYNASCTSMDTSCYIDHLVCGQVYSVTVEAIHSGCPGPASPPTTLTTGPCVPVIDSVHYNVSAAWVSWVPANGASLYSVQAVANHNQLVTCDTNNTFCFLSGLQCSLIYNVTVTARNQACDSMTSELSHLMTAPCPPTNVQATFSCQQLSAAVSWQQSELAVGYVAYLDNLRGHSTSCVGEQSDTSCAVSNLTCGTVYNVWVKALGAQYNSSDSSVVSLTSAPCQPSSISAVADCEDNFASVTWQLAAGAQSYVTVLTSTSGHSSTCSTNLTSCQLSSLQCGERYTVTVTSHGQTCNSIAQMAGFLTTAPCLPSQVNVRVSCECDGDALVSWSSAQGATNVSLKAVVGGSLQNLCTSQQNSCNVTGLSCSASYNLSLIASNDQCSITAPTHANLTTRPCPPQHVAVSLQCGSSTANLSWEKRSDVELYKARAIKASGGQVTRCNSTGSSCQFPGLDCGEMYNFTVRAYGQGCWSQESSMVFIQTEPCQTQIVSAQALCQSEEVQISWTQAAGVVNYLVTVTGNLGDVKVFNTTQTLLSATLPCGQLYSVTVEGQGSKCNSNPSSPVFFTTGPCVPSSVATSMQCEFNMGSVSWSPSDGAESYVAIATSIDGHTHKCHTNTTSCTWNDLHCGEEYAVVVSAKAGNCTSLPSNSSVIHMDPCTPKNLFASVSCDTKVVSLSWDGSLGATQYSASAETGDKSVSLITNITTAHFSELICGQNYSLTVTPQNQNCAGSLSAPTFVQTWPCAPSGISASQDCISGIAVVSWQASNGSDYYTATMATDSLSQTCMSNINGCSVTHLPCGHNFSVSVTASNQQCNVTSTQTASLQSVPCIPRNVSVDLDCASNTAAVSWSPSRGAVGYSMISNSSCQVFDLGCLACGSSYAVQVVAKDDKCSSIPSQAVVFYSSPCPPQNLSAQLSCSSNDLTISWEAVRDSDRFLVSLTPEIGGTTDVCNTTNTTCSTGSIACGSVFTVQVASVRGGCQSEPVQTQSIQSASCQPQGVRGSLNCVTNSAWISWDAAPGAESYFVSAVDGENYSANCTTSINTTCEVTDLACGVLYNFTVTARNTNCESSPSASISLQTAPCSLSGITAFTQCHNSSILVVWDLVKDGGGTTMYTVTAEASDHTILTCNSTGTSCYIHGARCDLGYTIIVAASSEQCSGLRSPPYRISMEPCPPRDMMVNASCEDHSALVSWTPSPVAEAYHVVAMAAHGHKHTCNTTSSNCSLSQLSCDQQYTVFVIASHENCSSKACHNATLTTGPCQPSGLSVEYHCDSLAAALSWTPSINAKEYYSSAQAGNGDTLYCYSSNSTCTIEGLECGATYNVSVQASDGTCNSSLSAPVQTGGAPCPPGSVEVHLMPMELEMQWLHFSWTQIICGETEYLLSLTGNLLGDNQEQFELSSYWTNIMYFEIPLPCSSYYAATLQSRNAAGTSATTAPLNGTTAPCPPSGVIYSGNSSLATVSWNASVFANTYTIYDSSVVPKVQLCSTPMLACSLFNITSSSLQIIASNAAGESQPADIPLRTLVRRRRDLSENVQVDGAPLIEVTQPAATIVYLQWPQVEDATFYDLWINNQGSSDGSQELHVYGDSIILSDLSPGSTYCFSIMAVTGTMSGPESKPVCVQTSQML